MYDISFDIVHHSMLENLVQFDHNVHLNCNYLVDEYFNFHDYFYLCLPRSTLLHYYTVTIVIFCCKQSNIAILEVQNRYFEIASVF